CGQAHAGAAGEAPVDVGHEGRPLLVMDGDELDWAVEQRVNHVYVLSAGDAEDVIDAFVLEGLDEELGSFHRSCLQSKGPGRALCPRRSSPGSMLERRPSSSRA